MRIPLHHICWMLLGGLACGPPGAWAATVEVVERSDPAGIVSRSTMVETPVEHLTLTAPDESGEVRFTHWALNGVRTNDLTGRARNPVRFMVYEAVDAVAQYVATTNDSDADEIPDWFEIQFYSDLDENAVSDTDGDGLTLTEEYLYDLHPCLSNSFLFGGLSMRNSAVLTVSLGSSYTYSERSEPAGLVSRSLVVSNGTVVTSTNLGEENAGYAFAYWSVGGVRQTNTSGMTLTRFSSLITNNTEAVALYAPVDQDTVGDGIPDWWRLRHDGNLAGLPDFDADGDGLTFAEEYRIESNPMISNSFAFAGVSMRNSERISVNLAGFFDWSIQCDPVGLISSQSGVAQTGTVLSTTSLGDSMSGYEFGCWSLNGVRQTDPTGVALSKISFEVTTQMNAVAQYYLMTDDTDANGLPDWWEVRYLGSQGQDPDADLSSDGLTVGEAYQVGLNPVLSNTFLSGGISMRDSSVVSVNLQPYERVEHVLLDGVLTPFFTVWPTNEVVSGMDFGCDTAPGTGDWDGDGDLDLFVGTSGGVIRVYENIGTAHTLNFSERSDAFAGLSASWDDLPHPYPSLGDWNGDGMDDLAVGGDTGRVRIVSSPGDFADPQSPATSYDLVIADAAVALPSFAEVTGDAHLDLLVLTDDGLVRVYANSGNPSLPFVGGPVEINLFGAPVTAGSGLSMRDINRDGAIDALASDEEGRIWEYYRNVSSNFVLQSKVWGGTGPGYATRLTLGAGDVDGDGDTDSFLGYDHGGLMLIRDPKIGPPAGLQAFDGPDSILLQWEPDRQTRVLGYHIYRGASSTGAFERLTDAPHIHAEYRDSTAPSGSTSTYYVTAVSAAYLPGNTLPLPVESPPSDQVSASTRSVVLWMSDYVGRRGEWAILQVNIENADGLSGTDLDIHITYDPVFIRPATQLDATNITVHRTPLSESFILSDNASTATGVLQITSSGGTVAAGEGRLLDIAFGVTTGAVLGAQTTNSIIQATLFGPGGQPMGVDYSATAVLTVANIYFLGDVNGDGLLDMDDHHMQLWLLRKNTRDPTPEEVFAGDINGNGKLDHRDISLLIFLIHGWSIYVGN
jgi:FG-GAP-like repeat/Dockerin type I domain